MKAERRENVLSYAHQRFLNIGYLDPNIHTPIFDDIFCIQKDKTTKKERLLQNKKGAIGGNLNNTNDKKQKKERKKNKECTAGNR